MTRICIVPHYLSIGGPASFQRKFTAGVSARGYEVTFDLKDEPYAAVLVIGGTRHLTALARVRQKGVPIVHRLDGLNWTHRKRATGLRHFMNSEIKNAILRVIRRFVATRIVYQSRFVQGWWEGEHGVAPTPATVIYNGVDLDVYSPQGKADRPADRYRILSVEGSYGDGFEGCLQNAISLAEALASRQSRPVELAVAGRVPAGVVSEWNTKARIPVRWLGLIPPEQIPETDRSAHLLFSAEVNAPSPNSVIEALACGLPVVSYITGSLPELVQDDAGALVPYSGDPWRFDPPDVDALAQATLQILEEPDRFRRGARARAEAAFGLEKMVSSYLEVLTA